MRNSHNYTKREFYDERSKNEKTFFVSLFWGNLYAKSAFTLDLRNDIIISTLSVGVFFGSFLIEETSDIPNVDMNDVNVIDRRLMFSYSRFHIIPNILLPVMGVMPIIVPISLVEWNIRNDFDIWLTYGLMYAQAVGFTYGTRRIIGRTVDRHRPFYYFTDVMESRPANSFPSGSTAMAFMPAAFFSTIFFAEFPDSPWRIPVIIGSHTLAAGVGMARIMAGRHFLTDVLAGAAIGSFFGWVIPTLHRRPALHLGPNDESKFSFHLAGNGAMMSLRL